jgi:membrane-associated phospholipid phosphatase
VERTARWWAAGAVYRWHEIARELTARHHLNSSHSSRLFAALAVAQHDAALAAALERTDAASAAVQDAAIAYASVAVLAEIFPGERRFLEQNALAHVASRVGAAAATEAGRGRALGQAVGDRVVAHLRADGAAGAREPRVAQQPGKWYSNKQTLPGWSRVRPWVMDSADQFRAPPPPPVDSEEFRRALEEVRRYSARRSAEHLAIAAHWNLGVGGISVPGMWGARALQDARAAGWSELRTARLMAVLHMAMFDACIASWETKYHYLVPRPSMLAPDIDEPLGLPPHPSYTSGHSAFSGAAQAVLSAAFPPLAEQFSALAEEASASRFFGGIHYRFDGDQGLVQGRKAGALALQRHPLL